MLCRSFNRRTILLFTFGALLGFFAPLFIRKQFVIQLPPDCTKMPKIRTERSIKTEPEEVLLKRKGFIFVGVMTAEKFLDTRAKAVFETWGKTIPGKLEFFSSSSSARSDLPLVSLPGVDDTYPPQRKSMMMMKYMHDNYIDDYEWFMRSDDDVYIRSDNLMRFLETLNSTEELYIGQAGTGRRDEKGTLGLGWGDNFCMGGPGVVMSRSTLRKMAPNVNYCLNRLQTTHEDVEIGRCVKMFVGVSCTWAFEMQSLFYHNRSKSQAFTQNLDTKAVRNAITLHPIKRAQYMYRLHVHFLMLKIQDALYKTVTLQRRLRVTEWLLKNGIANVTDEELILMNDIRDFHHLMTEDDGLDWEMLTPRKHYSYTENAPEIGLLNPTKDGMNKVLQETMIIINKEARKVLHRTLDFKRLNHGYMRYHPTYGAQFMLDLLMKYHRHIGYNRRRMTVHVRHHAYLQQPVGNLVYTAEKYQSVHRPINILLPLTGRITQFKRFMKMFEKLCLKEPCEHVLVILYFIETSSYDEHKSIFDKLKEKYDTNRLRWVEVSGRFSRALALSIGARHFDTNALLFFCDVDLDLAPEFFYRCQSQSILGKQVYYPVVFSQFNPEIAYYNDTNPNNNFMYTNNAGFWRQYAFGIACMHRADLDFIGGFDTTIQGWGLEDVDLYDRFVASDTYVVFRAVDPSIVHVYHDVTCNTTLATNQYNMCLGSRSQVYGSAGKLMEILKDKSLI